MGLKRIRESLQALQVKPFSVFFEAFPVMCSRIRELYPDVFARNILKYCHDECGVGSGS